MLAEPKGKTFLELVIPHLRSIKIKCFRTQVFHRHLPDPTDTRVPGPPESLVHGCSRTDLERHATAVNIQNIPVRRQHLIHILRGQGILHFVIHMEYSHPTSILPDMLHTGIQQHTAVLTPRKRKVHIIILAEDSSDPLPQRLIYIHPSSSHSLSAILFPTVGTHTYQFHHNI